MYIKNREEAGQEGDLKKKKKTQDNKTKSLFYQYHDALVSLIGKLFCQKKKKGLELWSLKTTRNPSCFLFFLSWIFLDDDEDKDVKEESQLIRIIYLGEQLQLRNCYSRITERFKTLERRGHM